jgi:serine/threonine protein kinase
MGVVYEAEQESLGRRVAIKVLPFHSLMDGRRLERFRREAQAAARLQHPHIVMVHGVYEEGGVHFFAMQLVEGEGLDRVIQEVRKLSGCGDPAAAGGDSPASTSRSTSLALALLHGAIPRPARRRPSSLQPGGPPCRTAAPCLPATSAASLASGRRLPTRSPARIPTASSIATSSLRTSSWMRVATCG